MIGFLYYIQADDLYVVVYSYEEQQAEVYFCNISDALEYCYFTGVEIQWK